MYKSSMTVVRCTIGVTDGLKVDVKLDQELALSSFLFCMVMDRLTDEVRQASLWTMVFAEDIVMRGESREHGVRKSGEMEVCDGKE